jgi:hypothetical protein
MTDTIEALRDEIDTLKAQFNEFRAYAKPIIDAHQPIAPVMAFPAMPSEQFLKEHPIAAAVFGRRSKKDG